MQNSRAGIITITVFLITFFSSAAWAQQLYSINDGSVTFRSEAPLELIEASTQKLKGAIDTQKQTFAFTIESSTFEGFNSQLQREHFNENYMESAKYPKSSFSGKIIEKVDFTKDGEYVLRAKGKLVIHGVEQERIIRSVVTVKNGEVRIKSNFTVLLKDHNISIPRVVNQKIAEEIKVEIDAVAKKK
jgi:polyisoprenoid-binding protein YceI